MTPKFKFQVVTELMGGKKIATQAGRVYGVHPNTINAWKRTFTEKRVKIFSQDSVVAQYEWRTAELE